MVGGLLGFGHGSQSVVPYEIIRILVKVAAAVAAILIRNVGG